MTDEKLQQAIGIGDGVMTMKGKVMQDNGVGSPCGAPLIERLHVEADLFRSEGANDIADLIDEAVRELKGAYKAFRMLNGMFSRNCIVMQAAVADMMLCGDKQGMQWIINTLDGPGLLPDIEAVKAVGGAQAWFDAELAAERAAG